MAVCSLVANKALTFMGTSFFVVCMPSLTLAIIVLDARNVQTMLDRAHRNLRPVAEATRLSLLPVAVVLATDRRLIQCQPLTQVNRSMLILTITITITVTTTTINISQTEAYLGMTYSYL